MPEKTITIPLDGMVDVSDVIRIINTYPYQRLDGVGQLGLVKKIFPGAGNTRFEHGIGTFAKLKRMLDNRGFSNIEMY